MLIVLPISLILWCIRSLQVYKLKTVILPCVYTASYVVTCSVCAYCGGGCIARHSAGGAVHRPSSTALGWHGWLRPCGPP